MSLSHTVSWNTACSFMSLSHPDFYHIFIMAYSCYFLKYDLGLVSYGTLSCCFKFYPHWDSCILLYDVVVVALHLECKLKEYILDNVKNKTYWSLM